MKKFKILLCLSLIFLSTFILTGCFREPTLEDYVKELNENNYTVECPMDLNISFYVNGSKESTTKEHYDIVMECDKNQCFSTINNGTKTTYSYSVINDNLVDTYNKVWDEWEKEDSIDIDDYSNLVEILDIDLVDSFTQKDNIYSGNLEKLNKELEEYMNELAKDYGKTGFLLEKATVNKYNIEIKDKHIYNIDTRMSIEMSYSSSWYRCDLFLRISMSMTYSNIGKTKVTKPDILN